MTYLLILLLKGYWTRQNPHSVSVVSVQAPDVRLVVLYSLLEKLL